MNGWIKLIGGCRSATGHPTSTLQFINEVVLLIDLNWFRLDNFMNDYQRLISKQITTINFID